MTQRLASRVAVGDEAVALLHELTEYVDARSEAFCTSSAWLLAAAEHLAAEPVLVVVRDGGAPVAVAALGTEQRRGARRIELLGGELNDYGQLFHDDEQAGAALADAIATWLLAQHRWSLSLGQLAAADPVALALAARLGGDLEPGAPMPQIEGPGTDYRVSKSRRRNATKVANRLTSGGHDWRIVDVVDVDGIDQWLPRVIAVRQIRDHGCGRRSLLDDAGGQAFYETFVRGAFARGRARLALLLVDGEVAGYSMVMHDGAVDRLYDGRVAEGLLHFHGGMICDLHVVARAAEDPKVTRFDWLRGSGESKFGNAEIHRVGLRADSHRWVRAVGEWEGAARRRIKAVLPETAVRKLVAR